MNNKKTHFGYQEVPVEEKASHVKDVFDSVSNNYDLMNDLMSFGIHRLWKRFAINACQIRPNHKVLDLAGGTGDLTAKISPLLTENGQAIVTDINEKMLRVAQRRLLDQGIHDNIGFVLADAETLPFPSHYFDCIIIGFGLRNVTDKDKALRSMYRVLKPAGKAIVLEFSKPTFPALRTLYDAYSFQLLPKLGKWVANDEASYRYLAESIRKHPDQATLLNRMESAGFEDCTYHNLSGGIVALHKGYKY